MDKRTCFLVVVTAACSAAPPVVPEVCPLELAAPCPATVDVRTLLTEMVDLRRLARPACPRFTTHLASSRDPRSVIERKDDPDDGWTGWFANRDWGNYLRAEPIDGRTEQVMLDVAGPGAIVRMWTANGAGGTVRVYVDGALEPSIAADFHALLGGGVAPFGAPFSEVNSVGRNLDFPIPFREHVKVTLEGDTGVYFYQLFYRLYEPGTDVTSFSPQAIPGEVMACVGEILRGTAVLPPADVVAVESEGEALALDAAEGGSEITELVLAPSHLDAATLRDTLISLSFDGEETVRVPLGDFFGAGPGFLPHRTSPLEVTLAGAFVSRFVMPFREHAAVRVIGPPGRHVLLGLKHRAAPFTDASFHFHARWIARGPIPSRPFRDLTVAHVDGRGTYVGTMLSVDSRTSDWWGEGDEKIFVDDDHTPRWFGTGTEDYFGYAYSTRDPFQHAYRMLVPTGSERGQVASTRVHVLDAIPFDARLRFDLELWHWTEDTTIGFDTVAYFYAASGARVLAVP